MSDDPTRSHAGGNDPTRTLDAGAGREPSRPLPARIGRYAIVRILGQGGMGTVYEAQQENPKRTVALKVIRAGYLSPELMRRFGQESQVLGRLQHPGIAQVYEAGTVDDERGHPMPFFAMEFIKAVPLTQFAASRRLGTRERLELVAKVCDAVYHAHQKGVIHRDLKPGNILVDESGQPKILDFGVARATDSDIQQTTLQTDIGQLIGTVPYMSPEQVSGDPSDLDTRSDVYALGVIAYEILAERLPYNVQKKMIHEAARIIREEEPTRLSSVNRTLRGDVETIVAKALEKDKTRRYQSAESLASDIRRYLKDEPIAARPASTWYQLQKFTRRNTGLVAGIAAAFVLLIAGLIGTAYGLKQAVFARDNEAAARKEADLQREAAVTARNSEAAQRRAAEAQRDKAEKIAEFMSQMLKGAAPSVALGRDSKMLKEMMDQAAARIQKGELKDAPEAELQLRLTLGDTYQDLSLYDESLKMLEPALPLARALHAGDHEDVAKSLGYLASLLMDRGDYARAESLSREALEMKKRLFAEDHLLVADELTSLAKVLEYSGDLSQTESLFRAALEMRKRLFAGDHVAVAAGLSNLASNCYRRGDLSGAERYERESLEMRRRLFPGDHPDVATSLSHLGTYLQVHGNPAGAEPYVRESLEMSRRLYPGDHVNVASCLSNLAALLVVSKGDLEGAERLLREALDMRRRMFPPDHPAIVDTTNNVAILAFRRGDYTAAEPAFREVLAIRRRTFPGDHPKVAESLYTIARVLQAQGNAAASVPLFREALEMRRHLYPNDHVDLAETAHTLAVVLEELGDRDAALPLFRESLDMRRRLLPADDLETQYTRMALATLLFDMDRSADAEPLLREIISAREKDAPGKVPWKIYTYRSRLGASLAAKGRYSEAEPLLTESQTALVTADATSRKPVDQLSRARERLVSLYEAWDKAEPGMGYDAKAAEWRAKLAEMNAPAKPVDKQ